MFMQNQKIYGTNQKKFKKIEKNNKKLDKDKRNPSDLPETVFSKDKK